MKFLAMLLLLALLFGGAGAAYAWYSIEKPFGTYSSEGVFVDVHVAPRAAAWRVCLRKTA